MCDVTWWRHNENIFTDSLSLIKNLSFDVSHSLVRCKEKFDLIFGLPLWRHRTLFFGWWRHQSIERQKLIKHGKLEKNRWCSFCGAQISLIYCSNSKTAPLLRDPCRWSGTEFNKLFFLNLISFDSRKKKFFY